MSVRHVWCGVLLLGVWGSAAAQNFQLTIKGGTYFTAASGCALAFRNADVRADGTLDAPDGLLFFYGDTDQALYSRIPVPVRELRLLKQAGSRVVLHTDVQASGLVDFGGGDLELNGFDLTVAGTGLQNENDASRVTGLDGGSVVTGLSGVDAPNQVDAGHLGAVISSAADLGNLTIKRMHKPFQEGNASGIGRSYFIGPQTNSGLPATLRFSYLDAELNGENPATLTLWKSDDGITWTSYAPDSANGAGQFRFVEKRGIDPFGLWTVADAANPLSVVVSSFSAVCQDNYALVQWQAADEGIADHFEVERSTDGSTWVDLGSVAVVHQPGGSGGLGGSSYSFKDFAPEAADFYRLAMVDGSGAVQYSPAFSGGCSDVSLPVSVYPNPAKEEATVQLGMREAGRGTLQVVNTSGAVVATRDCQLTVGINQLTVPLFGLAPGVYFLRLVTKKEQYHVPLMKK